MEFPTLVPAPQPGPHIPLDIQLVIVDMCPDVRTRLRLVSTHKAVRYRGARLALQLPSARVQLRSQSTTRSFFAFCAARGLPREPSSPIALLHTLDIDVATVNPADTGNLVTLLANVPRLTSLTLRHPEEALRSVSLLYPTLRRLRTLKTFHVHEAGPMAVKLVSEIASALEDITIDRHHGLSTGEDGARIHGLNALLEPHKDTLRRIFVCGMNIVEDKYAVGRDLVIFKKVRELVIPDCVLRDALYCMKTFPNAVSLDVGTALTTRAKRLSQKMTQWRANNRRILLNDDAIRAGLLSWPASLEHIRGGLLDLYVFGNPYWVEVLEIDGLIEDDYECVPTIVQSHCPEILRLSVSSSLRVDGWEKHRKTLDSVACLILQLVVEDLVDLKQLTVSVPIHFYTYLIPLTAVYLHRIQRYVPWGRSKTVRSSSLTSQHETTGHIVDFRASITAPFYASLGLGSRDLLTSSFAHPSRQHTGAAIRSPSGHGWSSVCRQRQTSRRWTASRRSMSPMIGCKTRTRVGLSLSGFMIAVGHRTEMYLISPCCMI